jgi:hypothetical protein
MKTRVALIGRHLELVDMVPEQQSVERMKLEAAERVVKQHKEHPETLPSFQLGELAEDMRRQVVGMDAVSAALWNPSEFLPALGSGVSAMDVCHREVLGHNAINALNLGAKDFAQMPNNVETTLAQRHVEGVAAKANVVRVRGSSSKGRAEVLSVSKGMEQSGDFRVFGLGAEQVRAARKQRAIDQLQAKADKASLAKEKRSLTDLAEVNAAEAQIVSWVNGGERPGKKALTKWLQTCPAILRNEGLTREAKRLQEEKKLADFRAGVEALAKGVINARPNGLAVEL